METRIVLVSVENESSNLKINFECDLATTMYGDHEKMSDRDHIIKHFRTHYPELRSKLEDLSIELTLPSKHFPGKLVFVSASTKIPPFSEVTLKLKRRIPDSQDGDVLIAPEADFLSSALRMCMNSSLLDSPQSEAPYIMDLDNRVVSSGPLTNNSTINPVAGPSTEPSQQLRPPIGTSHQNQPLLHDTSVPSPNLVTSPLRRTCPRSVSTPEPPLCPDTADISQRGNRSHSVGPYRPFQANNHERRSRPRTRMGRFNPPSFFTSTINMKIDSRKELTRDEENRVCRMVVDRIIETCDDPDEPSIELVIDSTFALHPGLAGPVLEIEGMETARLKALKAHWSFKLRKRLSRLRGLSGTQINKGGRPRKENGRSSGPSAVTTDECYDFDQASYEEHKKRLLAVFNETPSHPSLRNLFSLTFTGRRALLESGKLSTSTELLKDHCPLLSEKTYICSEFNHILKNPKACDTFQERWYKLVPEIFNLARELRTESHVQKVLRERPSVDDGTTALMLLAVMMPGNIKTAYANIKFLIEIIDPSQNLMDEIGRVVRPCPFIIKCGSTFYVTVDNKPLITLESGNASDALLCVVSAYYAFHIQYEKKLEPLFLFLEHHMLNKPLNGPTTAVSKVQKFMRLLKSSNVPNC